MSLHRDERIVENSNLVKIANRTIQEAQIHAQEAKTMKSIVLEIYQYCGFQKGNWNGAKPIIDYIEHLKAKNKELRGMIDNGLGWEDMHNDMTRP